MKDLRNRHFDLIAFAYDRLLGPPHADDLKELLRLPTRGRLLDTGSDRIGPPGARPLPRHQKKPPVPVLDPGRQAGLNPLQAPLREEPPQRDHSPRV
ncbi:MAG: hypothetical protein ABIJ57_02840 [Pseudomonadota bacterium]|nr:hypothetical protein [Pseudomonadota bacterium]MBU4120755.1 hypothetical protein [Pseudomonadota bacterium]